MQIVSKVCKNQNCGEVFQSLQYYNKEYCSPKCRRRAKHMREHSIAVVDPMDDNRFFATVRDPNEQQLDKYAELLSLDATNGKPIR